MGTWGFNVLENDASSDAYAEYVDAMNAGLSPAKALAKVKAELREMMSDPDDAAYAWLGIAKAMWEYGHIDAATISRIEKLARSDSHHLAEWDDAGPKGRQKREKVLLGFVTKLRSNNPKPKKARAAKLRLPIYAPGTCLAFKTSNGNYIAALVTFDHRESDKPGIDHFGINTVVLLDYLSAKLPSIEFFKQRQFAREEPSSGLIKPWLPIARMFYSTFKKKYQDITVVGQIKLSRKDLILPSSILSWNYDELVKSIQSWQKTKRKKNLLIADRLVDVPAYRQSIEETARVIRDKKWLARQLDIESRVVLPDDL